MTHQASGVPYNPEHKKPAAQVLSVLNLSFPEYGSAVASFAVMIGGAAVLLWVSRGTQFHQLAIGMMMSSIALTLAFGLFELCWQVGSHVMTLFDPEEKELSVRG